MFSWISLWQKQSLLLLHIYVLFKIGPNLTHFNKLLRNSLRSCCSRFENPLKRAWTFLSSSAAAAALSHVETQRRVAPLRLLCQLGDEEKHHLQPAGVLPGRTRSRDSRVLHRQSVSEFHERRRTHRPHVRRLVSFVCAHMFFVEPILESFNFVFYREKLVFAA